MVEWIQSLNWTQIAALVAAILSAFFGVKDKLPSPTGVVKSLGKLLPGGGQSTMVMKLDDEHEDLNAILRLEQRAERRGCKKLSAAVKEVQHCYFNRKEAEVEA